MERTQNTSTQKPVAEIKSGAIAAAIWQNEGQQGPYYTVTFSRFYKKDDQWQRTKTFRPKDMPAVADVAGQVTAHIATLTSGPEDPEPAAPETPKKKAPRRGKGKAPAA